MYTIVWYIHTYFSLTDIPSFYSMELKAFLFKNHEKFSCIPFFGIFTPILVSQ